MGRRRPGLLTRSRLVNRSAPFIAFDIETTRISIGTPRPLYFTAWGENTFISEPINDEEHLATVICDKLLIKQYNRYRLCGWNSGRFDLYLVLKALAKWADCRIYPFVGRSDLKAAVIENNAGTFTFCDGKIMTGFNGTLAEFSQTFISKSKLDLPSPIFSDGGTFNPRNKGHVLYAERDAEITYKSLFECDRLLREKLGTGLKATIGSLSAQYFRSQMPEGVWTRTPPPKCRAAIHNSAYRGGFVWCSQQYWGQAYHYDINQAYGGAMRDTDLPCGSVARTTAFHPNKKGIYYVTGKFTRHLRVPFYATQTDNRSKHRSNFYSTELPPCWLCDFELEGLQREGLVHKILDGWIWEESFNFSQAVFNLESARKNGGALSPIIKSIGNTGYGKFADRGTDLEYLFCKTPPQQKGFFQMDPFDENKDFVWCRRGTNEKIYSPGYQPQLATFISAQVRWDVRQAAIAQGENFISCDTDSLILKKPAREIAIHPDTYGAWKVEAHDEEFIVVGRKVYANLTTQKIKSTGINGVTIEEVKNWYNGTPPTKGLKSRRNALRVVFGEGMFYDMERSGTDFQNLNNITLQDRRFSPIF